MSRQTVYEWDLESYDENDEISDHDHSDNCPGLPDDSSTKLVLVRDVIDDCKGLIDRSWAYVVDGKLPESFCDAYDQPCYTVPKRFHKELERKVNQ